MPTIPPMSALPAAGPPAQRLENNRSPLALRLIGWAEDGVHYLVMLLLFGAAVIVLYRTGRELGAGHRAFPEDVTTVVNGALFVVIVMEVLRTVLAHFEHTGIQLQPFLIIGIVSATREILTVGAKLSLEGGKTTTALRDSLLELGVNAAVVLVLAGALVLIRRGAGMIED